MIDRRHIGTVLPPYTALAEPFQLRFFAKATGQDDPVYFDDAAARAAGYTALPVPPTFLFCMEMEGPESTSVRERLGLDYTRILHGEQGFTYHRTAYAGERLRFQQRITDIYDKKGGTLEFVVRLTDVTDEQGQPVAELRSVLVYTNLANVQSASKAPQAQAQAPGAPA
jgi:acyl dehydratase